jgi:hypothetical protein
VRRAFVFFPLFFVATVLGACAPTGVSIESPNQLDHSDADDIADGGNNETPVPDNPGEGPNVPPPSAPLYPAAYSGYTNPPPNGSQVTFYIDAAMSDFYFYIRYVSDPPISPAFVIENLKTIQANVAFTPSAPQWVDGENLCQFGKKVFESVSSQQWQVPLIAGFQKFPYTTAAGEALHTNLQKTIFSVSLRVFSEAFQHANQSSALCTPDSGSNLQNRSLFNSYIDYMINSLS